MDDEEAVVLSAKPANLCKVVTNPPAKFTEQVVLTARLRRFTSASGDISLNLGTGRFTGGYTVNLPAALTIPAGKASASTTFTITVDTVPENKELDIIGKIKDSSAGRLSAPISGTPGVVPAKLTIREFNLDVDRNGLTARDGIMAMRYLLGVQDEKLTAGQSSANHADVAKCFSGGVTQLDVDQEGEPDWRDGALIARYLFGLRGGALFEGLGIVDEKKSEAKKNLKNLCPGCKALCPDCEE
ncbi:MAG: hypothetical protein IBGAMO2_20001 [Arenicellales bacterium IbO2]|nr:MAG: hypothetical protein IBGAMO2_20001 [Arenicellales bacterium IbO2]